MTDNLYPPFRQERCDLCKAGVPMSAAARYHFDGNIHDPDDNPMRCTAPTGTEYIAELTARIAELEKDRAELRTAAIRFINEAPREGDFAIMMLGLSGTAKPEHRPMIDAYSAARRELYGLLAAGTAVND